MTNVFDVGPLLSGREPPSDFSNGGGLQTPDGNMPEKAIEIKLERHGPCSAALFRSGTAIS